MKPRAIVVGAGVAGLLAAHVLSRHYKEVLVLDRFETNPTKPFLRAGVPQYGQSHVLLIRGLEVLNRLIPGFEKRLFEQGAGRFEWLSETLSYSHGGFKPKVKTGLFGLNASRGLIETTVREAVQSLGNVRIVGCQKVTGLMQAGVNVSGVLVDESEMRADLVVVAAGRASKFLTWLQKFKLAQIPVLESDPKLVYATQWFKIPEHETLGHKLVSIYNFAAPGIPSGGLLKIENNLFLVSAYGGPGGSPPADAFGFLQFMSKLPGAGLLLQSLMARSVAVSPVLRFGGIKNIWHRFDRVRLPQGLVVLGDAVCTFNPAYGQGLTVAAMGAELLGEMHQKTIFDQHRFQKRLAGLLWVPWLLATNADIAYKFGKDARVTVVDRMNNFVLNTVLKTTNVDSGFTQAFVRVLNLMSPLTVFLHPRHSTALLSHLIRDTLQINSACLKRDIDEL